MCTEEWRECCDGYYEVSDHGRVRRSKPGPGSRVGRILKSNPDNRGYMTVSMYCNRERHGMTVHRLVASVFIGPRPDGYDINHIDGDKKNNRASNLEYLTRTANVHHAMRTGLMSNKIPQATVDRIRYLRSTGMLYKDISSDTGVERSYCRQIAIGQCRAIAIK